MLLNFSTPRAPGIGAINRFNNFSTGLTFLWQATDRLIVPRESVANQAGSFENGNSGGWRVVAADQVSNGHVWLADAATGATNTLAFNRNPYYETGVKGFTYAVRFNPISMPPNFAEFTFVPSGGGIYNDQPNTGNLGANSYAYQVFTNSGAQYVGFDNSGPAFPFGQWVTAIMRYPINDPILGTLMTYSYVTDDGVISLNGQGGVTAGDTVNMGANTWNPIFHGYNGYYDFIASWNYALSDAQISQLVISRNRLSDSTASRIFLVSVNPNQSVTPTPVFATGALGIVKASVTQNATVNPTAIAAAAKIGTPIATPTAVPVPAVATGATGTVTIGHGQNVTMTPQGIWANGATGAVLVNNVQAIVTGAQITSAAGNLAAAFATFLMESIPSTVSFAITISLDSLANNTARQSAALFNMSRYDDVLIRLSLIGTTFSVGPVDVYVYGSADGSNYVFSDNATGVDGTFTLPVLSSRYVGTIRLNGGSSIVSAPLSIASACFGEVPDAWGIIVVNRSGAALGVGNSAVWQGKGLMYNPAPFNSFNQSMSLSGLQVVSGIGSQTISNSAVAAPTKSGYTLSRDYTAGTTINSAVDMNNVFFWYPYPDFTLGAPTPAALVGLGYGLVWSDDFLTLDIGATGYHRWYPYPFSETQPPAAQVSVANSILTLTWKQGQSTNDTSISTGAYDRSEGQGWFHGYFEFFAKWDVASGAKPTFGGISLAHILQTDIVSGSESFATIDAFQGTGGTPTLLQGISTFSTGTFPNYTVTSFNASKTVTAIQSTDFHTYGFLWTAGNVAVYLDNVFQFNMSTSANTDTAKDAIALVLSAAWDGVNGPGATSLNVFIDWVRIWQLNQTSVVGLQGNDWEQLTNAAANWNVSGSNMVLTATLPTGTTGFDTNRQLCQPSETPILSGLIQTQFTQYYGYWEANVLIQKAAGGNPRFYLTAVNGSLRPQIMVAEWPAVTSTTSIHPAYPADAETITYSNTVAGYNKASDVYTPGFDYSLGLHLIGIDWTNGQYTNYVDGVIITSRTFHWLTNNGGDPGPAAAVLSMAIGTATGGTPALSGFPQSLKINYLRIWQKNPAIPTSIVSPPSGVINLMPTQDLVAWTPVQLPNPNLMVDTDTYNTANWAPFNTTFAASTVLDPISGTNFAQAVTFSTLRGGFDQTPSPALVAGSYTASIYARATSGTPCFFIGYYTQLGPISQYTAKLIPSSTAWTRYDLNFTVATGDVPTFVVVNSNIDGDTAATTGTIAFYAGKIEVGSVATPYTGT